jgi:hypothetical protein
VKEGDIVKTTRGSSKVTKLYSMILPNNESSRPYNVNGLLVSGNHLVMKENNLYQAS